VTFVLILGAHFIFENAAGKIVRRNCRRLSGNSWMKNQQAATAGEDRRHPPARARFAMDPLSQSRYQP
jgi:hypothetical protein